MEGESIEDEGDDQLARKPRRGRQVLVRKGDQTGGGHEDHSGVGDHHQESEDEHAAE
jgi:hypothetical protein